MNMCLHTARDCLWEHTEARMGASSLRIEVTGPFLFPASVPLDVSLSERKKLSSVLFHQIHFQLQVPSCRVILSLHWISIASFLKHLSQRLLLVLHLFYYLRLHLYFSYCVLLLFRVFNVAEAKMYQMFQLNSFSCSKTSLFPWYHSGYVGVKMCRCRNERITAQAGFSLYDKRLLSQVNS